MSKEHKELITIFLLALGVRLTLFIIVSPWSDEFAKERILTPDSYWYQNIAVNLLEHNVFSKSISSPYVPDIHRTPIYPFFLAFLYALFGYKLYIPILCQLLIGSLTCIVTYKVGKILFIEKSALCAGLLAAFEYSSVLLANILLTDTLFSFLFIMHIYFLIKSFKTNSKKIFVYSAILLGCAALCRPVSVYFFLFLIWIFVLQFKHNLFKCVFKYSIFTLVFILTLLPWMFRNYLVSGRFLVSSLQESVVHWNLPQITQSLQNLSPPSDKIEDIPSKIETNGTLKNLNIKSIVSAALLDAKRYITGAPRFFAIIGSAKYNQILNLSYNPIKASHNKGLLQLVKSAIQTKNTTEWFIICGATSFLIFLYITMCFGAYYAISSEIDLVARIMSMGRLHHSFAITGAIATAGAALAPGTVVNEILPKIRRNRETLNIGHPSGIINLKASIKFDNGRIIFEEAIVERTARRLMEGFVFVPECNFC
jgi:4-amino-4-deoxy-L-arabinose transferase-like glycosyltransferase